MANPVLLIDGKEKEKPEGSVVPQQVTVEKGNVVTPLTQTEGQVGGASLLKTILTGVAQQIKEEKDKDTRESWRKRRARENNRIEDMLRDSAADKQQWKNRANMITTLSEKSLKILDNPFIQELKSEQKNDLSEFLTENESMNELRNSLDFFKTSLPASFKSIVTLKGKIPGAEPMNNFIREAYNVIDRTGQEVKTTKKSYEDKGLADEMAVMTKKNEYLCSLEAAAVTAMNAIWWAKQPEEDESKDSKPKENGGFFSRLKNKAATKAKAVSKGTGKFVSNTEKGIRRELMLSENVVKEKGNVFSRLYKKAKGESSGETTEEPPSTKDVDETPDVTPTPTPQVEENPPVVTSGKDVLPPTTVETTDTLPLTPTKTGDETQTTPDVVLSPTTVETTDTVSLTPKKTEDETQTTPTETEDEEEEDSELSELAGDWGEGGKIKETHERDVFKKQKKDIEKQIDELEEKLADTNFKDKKDKTGKVINKNEKAILQERLEKLRGDLSDLEDMPYFDESSITEITNALANIEDRINEESLANKEKKLSQKIIDNLSESEKLGMKFLGLLLRGQNPNNSITTLEIRKEMKRVHQKDNPTETNDFEDEGKEAREHNARVKKLVPLYQTQYKRFESARHGNISFDKKDSWKKFLLQIFEFASRTDAIGERLPKIIALTVFEALRYLPEKGKKAVEETVDNIFKKILTEIIEMKPNEDTSGNDTTSKPKEDTNPGSDTTPKPTEKKAPKAIPNLDKYYDGISEQLDPIVSGSSPTTLTALLKQAAANIEGIRAKFGDETEDKLSNMIHDDLSQLPYCPDQPKDEKAAVEKGKEDTTQKEAVPTVKPGSREAILTDNWRNLRAIMRISAHSCYFACDIKAGEKLIGEKMLSKKLIDEKLEDYLKESAPGIATGNNFFVQLKLGPNMDETACSKILRKQFADKLLSALDDLHRNTGKKNPKLEKNVELLIDTLNKYMESIGSDPQAIKKFGDQLNDVVKKIGVGDFSRLIDDRYPLQ